MLPVKIRGSRAGNLLLTLSHIEKHGLVWLRPLEVKSFLDPVSWGEEDVILFSSLCRSFYLLMYHSENLFIPSSNQIVNSSIFTNLQ